MVKVGVRIWICFQVRVSTWVGVEVEIKVKFKVKFGVHIRIRVHSCGLGPILGRVPILDEVSVKVKDKVSGSRS